MTAKTPEQLVSVYGDMVYRLAYAQTRSRHDADDIFQEVFLQTVRKRPVFDSVEHEKAWLLRGLPLSILAIVCCTSVSLGVIFSFMPRYCL